VFSQIVSDSAALFANERFEVNLAKKIVGCTVDKRGG